MASNSIRDCALILAGVYIYKTYKECELGSERTSNGKNTDNLIYNKDTYNCHICGMEFRKEDSIKANEHYEECFLMNFESQPMGEEKSPKLMQWVQLKNLGRN